MGVSAIDSVVFDDIAELRGEAAAVSPHLSHGHRRVFQTLSLLSRLVYLRVCCIALTRSCVMAVFPGS